jgi:UDP-N-acetylmuramoyl-L-alanyl-D-glutamate--2,6-diaminopimelate ligase
MTAPLKLRHLVNRFGTLKVEGALDTPVAALAYDARRVVPGAVFFAMSDRARDDGRSAIPQAIERGAAAIVCEQPGFLPYRATRIRVTDCRQALAAAAAAFHGQPSQKLQVVVVSGCAARIPVAHLLAAVFRAADIPTGVIGSHGCDLGERTLPPLEGEAEALDVQERLAEMLRSGCRAGILELSPEALDRGVLAACELDHLIFTRITAGPDGEPAAGDSPLARPWEERLRFRRLNGGARTSGGLWQVDDALAGRAAAGAGLAFRIHGGAGPVHYRAGQVRTSLRGTRLDLTLPGGEPLVVRLPLPGRALARAALAVVGLAHRFKLPAGAVLRGLAHAPPVPGWCEPVSPVREFHVLVDAAPTLGDFEARLRELRDLTPGRLRVLFGCGRRHPAPERPAWGEVAARWADDVVLTDDNPGHEPAAAIAAAVARGYARMNGLPPLYVPDRAAAIATILANARAGDCVLLAGKGHRAVQETGGCVVPFDDRVQARAWLRAHPARGQAVPAEVMVS